MVGARDRLGHSDQFRPTALENLRADLTVGLDQLEFLSRESAGFEQDAVRNADLANIMQRRRAANQLDLILRQPQLVGQPGSHLADTPHVLTGVVIPILGRLG